MIRGGMVRTARIAPAAFFSAVAVAAPALGQSTGVLLSAPPEALSTVSGAQQLGAPRVISLNYLLSDRAPIAASSKKRSEHPQPEPSFADKLLLARAARIEGELSKVAGLPKPAPVEIDSSNQVNSWTDGHTVTVTQGLMRFVSDDNELAAVLGHETGHIQAGHVGKEGKTSLWALIGTALAATVAGRNAAAVTYMSSALVLKKYSRDEEAEADRIGLGLMEGAGYDGNAMSRFFEKLSRSETEDPALFSSFFADHPVNAERLHRLTTYPQLDPALLPNQLMLRKGLLSRGEPATAAAMSLRLAQKYPDSPEVRAAVEAAPSVAGNSLPAFAPGDLSVAPDDRDAPLTSSSELPALDPVREQTRKTASQFYECFHAMEGLENGFVGSGQDSSRNILYYHMLRSALESALQLGNTMDPTAAALLSVERASTLEKSASNYPTSSDSLSPQDASLLAEVSRQRSAAVDDMHEAVEYTRVASAAGQRDVHDLALGISHLEEWTPDSRIHTTGESALENGAAWFSTGEAGLSRSEAHDALQKASTAELRLEIAALDWQGRSLTPAQKRGFIQWAREYLSLPAKSYTQVSDSEGLGSALLQDLVSAFGDQKASAPQAIPSDRDAYYSIEIVESAPPGAFTPTTSQAADPVSQAIRKALNMDQLQTLFRPVFVHIEQEGSAAAGLEQAAGGTH